MATPKRTPTGGKGQPPRARRPLQDYHSALKSVELLMEGDRMQRARVESLMPYVIPDKDEKKSPAQMNTLSIAELAHLQAVLDDLHKAMDKTKSMAGVIYDMLRVGLLPVVMEEAGTESVKVTGVGTIFLQDDIRLKYIMPEGLDEEAADIAAAMKTDAICDWLETIGAGDVIKSTVNASTLKAMIKKRIKEGVKDAYPKDLMEVTPFTRSQINGRAKAAAELAGAASK